MTKPLEPGPELDALVEKELFGRDCCSCLAAFEAPSEHHYPAGGFNAKTGTHNACGKKGARHLSTDISAAWEVVEKMKKKGFALIVQETPLRKSQATFDGMDYGNTTITEHGESISHAICLAALKACKNV